MGSGGSVDTRTTLWVALIGLGAPLIIATSSIIQEWLKQRVSRVAGNGPIPVGQPVAPPSVVDHIQGRIDDLKERLRELEEDLDRCGLRLDQCGQKAERYLSERNAAWDQLRLLGVDPIFKFEGRAVPSVLPDSHPEEAGEVGDDGAAEPFGSERSTP